VPAGVLDAGTAWRRLFHHALRLRDGEPTLARLLIWAATSSAGVELYRQSADDFRVAVRQRLTGTLGPAGDAVLDMVEAGNGRDALAVALVCEVVFAEEQVNELQAAAVRLERFRGNQPIPPAVGRTLARAAEDAVRELAFDDPPGDQPHLTRADDLLREVQAASQAYRSRLTRLGWEQRQERFAAALSGSLTGSESAQPLPGGALEECAGLASQALDHVFAKQSACQLQVRRMKMSLRLLRWLHLPTATGSQFDEMVSRYRDDMAYVDWARDQLAGGDPAAPAALSVAYRFLVQAVQTRRDHFNEVFAREFCRSGQSAAAIPMERALAQVIVPLVRNGNRVLFAVLDGLSWAVTHELLPELRSQQWQELTWLESEQPPPPLLAALPSVTELSRTSLLAGQLVRGDAALEKQLFTGHAELAGACERRYPPVLFHKAQLTEGARGGLADDVQQTVASERHRVVGVVINAVDDELSGAEQVRHAWSLDAIRPLGALLRAARDAGRVVVLVSDHGHVWHRQDSVYHKATDGGERWRSAEGASPCQGEVLVEGARVRDGRDQPRIIVPWDERIRYGTAKSGYHGGVTPQEVLAPLVVLAPASTLPRKGLSPCHLQPPAWWEEPVAARPTEAPVPDRPARPAPRTMLFDFVPPPEEGAAPASEAAAVPPAKPAGVWLKQLLGSAVYEAQKQLVQKHLPEDTVVLRCLEALDRQGGTTTLAALAQQANVLPLRLDGLLAKLQRLLNVDGYEVLQVDRAQNRVSLNVPLLRRQFELE
jgi:hypothetical protein